MSRHSVHTRVSLSLFLLLVGVRRRRDLAVDILFPSAVLLLFPGHRLMRTLTREWERERDRGTSRDRLNNTCGGADALSTVLSSFEKKKGCALGFRDARGSFYQDFTRAVCASWEKTRRSMCCVVNSRWGQRIFECVWGKFLVCLFAWREG